MNIQFNPSTPNVVPSVQSDALRPAGASGGSGDFGKLVEQSFDKVNDQQNQANLTVVDLLNGKQQDVNSVVAEMAKADMSFKLLVGVRNKLVEAYKETMRMQI
ncbi:MAG: flagellar hook-basal body complex protein FliE [Planctomycetaceae bacterium]|nr:flagellar hook-basal body complex protein FliE [Planctomycetaceae bacterium]